MSTSPPRTHARIDPALCGTPRSLADGSSEVELTLIEAMRVDDTGLTHGGFTFGLADHAAMLAVNEPTVVLADASMRFLAPTVVGDRLVARGRVSDVAGKRRTVQVEVRRGDTMVAEGTFACAVPTRHVLQR